MLQKWKTILTNWINCFFNESNKKEQCVTLESLLNIISHLRDNLNLDESKSSILEAHTVEEFISEKYPEFRFNNRTFEAKSEDELYMAASLLLLFVCVNSKDVNIKNAMCSTLSAEDQEVILKFSKCLMESSPIIYKDLQAAIREACGSESDVMETDNACSTVSETPPALRSLHGEVRRLQASLDAERFDRNYLQEELSRTNLKLEQLLKDKEKYKIEIGNLKAKISMCCGQESDTTASNVATESTAKLIKQLEETEERLLVTQEQLSDAQYERDTYKAKVNELKQERDKLVILHQQEASKNNQLSEELENERRSASSLRELVVELRQHHQLNRLDSSQLECDDPDTSIQSLPHNSSICNEACANVIEVQLGEERAKIVLLKQQIQSLQEQLNDITQKTETEKLSLEKIISEKDNDIFNLKHRINEEIQIKNNMTIHYSDEVSKLNNDINELEQKLKENHVQYTLVIETKMKDIQTLQEEKLSLLQSFHDETTKLDNIVKNLKTELENEKVSKAKVKEEYDNHIMKLNEKVLNRNNELVELQNNVLQSSEQIEQLHLELRKEKQAREDVEQHCQRELEMVNGKRLEFENGVKQKREEIESLMDRLKHNENHIGQLNAELDYLKGSVSQLSETCNILEKNKTYLVNEIGIRDYKIEEQHKEIDNWKNKVSEEKDSYKKHKEEYEMKISILTKTIDDTREDMTKQKESYIAVLDSRARDIQTLQQENQSLHNELSNVKFELDQKVHSLQEKLIDNENLTEKLKTTYECQIENLNLMVTKLTNFLKDKTTEIDMGKAEKERLQETIDSNKKVIHDLEEEVKSQKYNQEKLISEFESERLVLKNMVTVTESVMEDQKESMNQVIMENAKENEYLKKEIEVLSQALDKEKKDLEDKLFEKEVAVEKAHEVLSRVQDDKEAAEINYEEVKENLSSEIKVLSEELKSKVRQIEQLESQHKEVVNTLDKFKNDYTLMVDSKLELVMDIEMLKEQNNILASEISNLDQRNKDLENMLQKSRNDVTSYEERYNELKLQKDSLEQSFKELEDQAKIVSIELNETKNVNTKHLENIDELKIKFKELTTQKDELVLELKDQIDKLKEDNSILNGIVNDSKMDVKMYEERCNELTLQKDSLDESFKELQGGAKIVSTELNETKKVNTKLLEDIDELKIKIKELTTQKEEMVSELKDQIIKLKEDNSKLNDIVDENKKDVKIFEERYNELKQQKHSLGLLSKEFEDRTQIVTDELNERIEVNTKLLQDNEELKIKVKELTTLKDEMVFELKAQIMKLKEDNSKLNSIVDNNNRDMVSLENALREQKENQAQEARDNETEKQKLREVNDTLNEEIEHLKKDYSQKITEIQEKETVHETKVAELYETIKEINNQQNVLEIEKEDLMHQLQTLNIEITVKVKDIETLEELNKELTDILSICKRDKTTVEDKSNELKIKLDMQESEFSNKLENVTKELNDQMEINKQLEETLGDKQQLNNQFEEKNIALNNELEVLTNAYNHLEQEKNNYKLILEELNLKISVAEEQLMEIHKLREENVMLTNCIVENKRDIASLENALREQKDIQAQKVHNSETEKQKLQEIIDTLNEEIKDMRKVNNGKITEIQERETVIETKVRKLYEIINEKENQQKVLEIEKDDLINQLEILKNEITIKVKDIELLQGQNKELTDILSTCKKDKAIVEDHSNELKIRMDMQESEFSNKLENVTKALNEQIEIKKQLEQTLGDKHKLNTQIEEKNVALNNQVEVLTKAYNRLEQEKNDYKTELEELKLKIAGEEEQLKEILELREENVILTKRMDENKLVILCLEETVKQVKDQNDFERLNLKNKCALLQEYQSKAEKLLEDRQKEVANLDEEVKKLSVKVDDDEKNMKEMNFCIRDKNEEIHKVKQELYEVKAVKEQLKTNLEAKESLIEALTEKLDRFNSEDAIKAFRNEEWVRAVGQKDLFAVASSEKTSSHKHSGSHEKDYRDYHHQVDNTTSDLAHSSMESIRTISDLEKIIHDKNRTITTLQTDATYLKSLIADSENKVLDISKELELSKENCQQLSSQLKKIVHQKNEEIADLKKQVTKMSVTENRATQIIKVSAKYQAIILKRIAEIKTNTVLKELTNFGNSANGDNELRRSLNAGTVTMEDLENFLETTDKHLRRCSEKQITLQKDRDRLAEVNRINESEIINLKKFLTELSVSFKTFSNVKELYTQKLSRVVSVQRTVRREILYLDGRINDASMCKLERGYAAVMQDLSETTMNLERWVERCISRTISSEKIKQAFMSDEERSSIAPNTFQNTSLEVQIGELDNSFQKLLEEVARAQKGEGAKDTQAVTVMEVRAEYEDKLNRMKAKMKQLYQEQVSVYKEKQKEENMTLERELMKAREKLSESSKAYEEHIRALTTELWRVGEKFLTKKDELEWLKKKQISGSLMSLQHVHSSGLVASQEEVSRISDAHSLRSLPVTNNTNKREARGLHMSDEEGEVFDNRWLHQLTTTPRRSPQRSPGPRLSELRWRNSLCPPHLKSSYPAETQFTAAVDEEDIKPELRWRNSLRRPLKNSYPVDTQFTAALDEDVKCFGAASLGGRSQRKEVGITAYKKPGPPTPSKQAGRLSATDSELRESLRLEPDAQASRKTSTPSRLRLLFRSSKNDTAEGTPRSRRLSIFRKK